MADSLRSQCFVADMHRCWVADEGVCRGTVATETEAGGTDRKEDEVVAHFGLGYGGVAD